ncbi:MAG: hypothetical protein CMF25_03400 [Kangiellaceae bacterium]|jgi:LuxR family maltose regulon positive regulatory protein|nr:hypothetical protein [Kangiellaceae bacterium]|tara:strand:+ start:1381 stop:3789 length:2409 start_codon:yes stop_codon:yes gene_type:complete
MTTPLFSSQLTSRLTWIAAPYGYGKTTLARRLFQQETNKQASDLLWIDSAEKLERARLKLPALSNDIHLCVIDGIEKLDRNAVVSFCLSQQKVVITSRHLPYPELTSQLLDVRLITAEQLMLSVEQQQAWLADNLPQLADSLMQEMREWLWWPRTLGMLASQSCEQLACGAPFVGLLRSMLCNEIMAQVVEPLGNSSQKLLSLIGVLQPMPKGLLLKIHQETELNTLLNPLHRQQLIKIEMQHGEEYLSLPPILAAVKEQLAPSKSQLARFANEIFNYFIQRQDWRRAGTFLVNSGDEATVESFLKHYGAALYQVGEFSLLNALTGHLTPSSLLKHVNLTSLQALLLLNKNRPRDTSLFIEQSLTENSHWTAGQQGNIRAILSLAQLTIGDIQQASASCQFALNHADQGFHQAIAYSTMGQINWEQSALDEAIVHLKKAMGLGFKYQSPQSALWTAFWLQLCYLEQGELDALEGVVRQAEKMAGEHGLSLNSSTGFILRAHSEYHLLMGQYEPAINALKKALRLTSGGPPEDQIAYFNLIVLALTLSDDLKQAGNYVEKMFEAEQSHTHLNTKLQNEYAALHYLLHKKNAAFFYPHLAIDASLLSPYQYQMHQRNSLLRAFMEEANEPLFATALRLYEHACDYQRPLDKLHNATLLLMVADEAHQKQAWRIWVSQLAEHDERLIIAFLNRYQMVANWPKKCMVASDKADRILLRFYQLNASKQRSEKNQDIPDAVRQIPLTQKEWEVLKLIGKNLSNDEICQQLFIAKSTLKTHINHLYQKLQVSRRRQARAKLEVLLNQNQ